LLRTLPLVTALVAGMLVLQAAVVTAAAQPATHNWFKSVRTGVVVSQGGEFGFALLILLLRDALLSPALVQPLLAATVLSMVLSPVLIRHNRRITRTILRESGPPRTEAMRETLSTLAVANRDHVVICGFGRVGQNIARVLEQNGFEYIALDLDPYRIRVGRQAGERAGATEVVPETFEASLMLLSHVLLLLKLPVARVIRTVNDIRSDRYGMLRQYFRAEGSDYLDDSHAFREELHSVILPPNAWAVGRSVAQLAERGSQAAVSAVRRDGIVGRDPSAETIFKEGDVVVVCGTPEAVEHAETLLLMG